jgi:PilZ domain
MGKRREPRHAIRIPVRIFGTDADGQMFSENVHSFDISNQGARLDGVKARLKVGEIIGVTQGQKKTRFCVQWVGQPDTSMAGQVGLVSVTQDKSIWDAPLAAKGPDTFAEPDPASERRKTVDRRQVTDRRGPPRLKCVISVQLQPSGQAAPIWGKAVDISSGGCFVEMPIPLQKGTKLNIGIWIKEHKLQASGRVVNSRPGFGIGVQFTEMSELDAAQLKDFLKSITQISY